MRNIVLSVGFFMLLSASFLQGAEDAPATFKVGEFSFTRPSAWEWVETTSSMRKAQLKVTDPKAKGTAEVVFFFFGPGGGGGAKANVDRWFGQFQDAKNKKTEEAKAAGTKVTYVQTEGTYMSGMPGGAKTAMPDQMLQGAILESDQGDVFVKMTGPVELVKATRETFRKMVETAKKG
ncbi:MAG TPA: hypothetical protein VMZ27_11125 [Candidatus Saccharimonadales bacterium]|nr:hypothetical protein [Candidatus Saccharimonadales bacterium]